MCQVSEDDINSLMQPKPDFKFFRKCLKCDNNSIMLTRINDPLCKECFMEYFVHKFRLTLGKNKIFEKNEPVLFPYSASGSSVSMLSLIVQGVGEEAKKKLTFKTSLLFIDDSLLYDKEADPAKRLDFINKIKKSTEYSHFVTYYSLLENCLISADSEEALYVESPEQLQFNKERTHSLVESIGKIDNQTSREEIIKRLRLDLINRIAIKLGTKKVIFASNCTKLTIDMLSNVAIGKGAHLSMEMTLVENRKENLIYVRPLRELTAKEIAFYNFYIGKLDLIYSNNINLLSPINSSIYRLTEKFINGLQNDYPTTVSTIFRTGDKLTPSEDFETNGTQRCILCHYPLDTTVNSNLASSALNNLDFTISISKPKKEESNEENNNFLIDQFCYSCSIIARDLKTRHNLPLNIREKLRDEMKEQIQEFLIENE